jgi:hypothetical protein
LLHSKSSASLHVDSSPTAACEWPAAVGAVRQQQLTAAAGGRTLWCTGIPFAPIIAIKHAADIALQRLPLLSGTKARRSAVGFQQEHRGRAAHFYVIDTRLP